MAKRAEVKLVIRRKPVEEGSAKQGCGERKTLSKKGKIGMPGFLLANTQPGYRQLPALSAVAIEGEIWG